MQIKTTGIQVFFLISNLANEIGDNTEQYSRFIFAGGASNNERSGATL